MCGSSFSSPLKPAKTSGSSKKPSYSRKGVTALPDLEKDSDSRKDATVLPELQRKVYSDSRKDVRVLPGLQRKMSTKPIVIKVQT